MKTQEQNSLTKNCFDEIENCLRRIINESHIIHPLDKNNNYENDEDIFSDVKKKFDENRKSQSPKTKNIFILITSDHNMNLQTFLTSLLMDYDESFVFLMNSDIERQKFKSSTCFNFEKPSDGSIDSIKNFFDISVKTSLSNSNLIDCSIEASYCYLKLRLKSKISLNELKVVVEDDEKSEIFERRIQKICNDEIRNIIIRESSSKIQLIHPNKSYRVVLYSNKELKASIYDVVIKSQPIPIFCRYLAKKDAELEELNSAIIHNKISSVKNMKILLDGPPGCGKSSFLNILASSVHEDYDDSYTINNLKTARILKLSKNIKFTDKGDGNYRAILFLDKPFNESTRSKREIISRTFSQNNKSYDNLELRINEMESKNIKYVVAIPKVDSFIDDDLAHSTEDILQHPGVIEAIKTVEIYLNDKFGKPIPVYPLVKLDYERDIKREFMALHLLENLLADD